MTRIQFQRELQIRLASLNCKIDLLRSLLPSEKQQEFDELLEEKKKDFIQNYPLASSLESDLVDELFQKLG